MGAGRKKTTIQLKEKSEDSRNVNNSASARNLTKVELGAIIFGCKNRTIKECFEKELFAGHYSYVKKATPGLTLFLFNYSDRKLHGVFEAVSFGQMNINPNAWITASEGAETTPYPAQVRIRATCRCRPLLEEEMKPIIASNYYTEKFFWFELDKEQTKRLMALFKSSPWPENILRPSKENKQSNALHAFCPEKKWSELFKSSSSSSAVNHAEVSEPQTLLNPPISVCLDVEWESASNYNAWGELPPEARYGAESDSSVVECWEDSDLVDSYLNEVYENSEQHNDGDSGRYNPTDMPSPVKAEEALIDSKGNNGSSITLAPVQDSGRDCGQLNLIDSTVQEDKPEGDVQYSHFLCLITKLNLVKLMEEIEKLKVSQFNQSRKIKTLEQELVQFRSWGGNIYTQIIKVVYSP